MSKPLEVAGARSPSPAGRRPLILAACVMATFMAAVENTIVATAMPTIVADLGEFHLFSWVFAAYLLSQAVSVPVYGRLADLYGRKRVFFAGAGLFLAGSTLCGVAHAMPALIVFRIVQGLGAGAVQPLAYTIVGDIYTPAERARVQGVLSGTFGVAAVVGPSLGAFLVEHASWPIVFWVNLPVGAAAFVMLAAFYRERPQRRAIRIDALGALLLMAGAALVMLPLVQAAQLSGGVLASCLAAGALALVGLAWHERRIADPMLPLRLWRNRVVALANAGGFTIGAAIMGVSTFLPTYVEAVMGGSAATAGIVLGAQPVGWAFASIAAGRLMIRTSYRVTLLAGGAAMILGSAVLAAMTPASGPLWAGLGALLMGGGLGFCNTTYLVAVQATVAQHERGAATSANLFLRTLGQASGAALFGAVVNYGVLWHAPDAGGAVERLLQPMLRGSLDPAVVAALGAAMAASIRIVYLLCGLLGVVVVVLGLRLPARLRPA
jgi:EmrB/QacA subfamily drug resistance transporter